MRRDAARRRSAAAPADTIPLHLAYEARDVRLTPGQPITWQLTLKPRPNHEETP